MTAIRYPETAAALEAVVNALLTRAEACEKVAALYHDRGEPEIAGWLAGKAWGLKSATDIFRGATTALGDVCLAPESCAPRPLVLRTAPRHLCGLLWSTVMLVA